MQEQWTADDPVDWGNESFAIAIVASTGYCTINGCACDLPGSQPVTIDSAYVEAATPIVRQRLGRAGARLAHMLDEAVGE